MLRIYVAGPFSSDPAGNTARAVEVARLLVAAGMHPFVPHVSCDWATVPNGYEGAMRECMAWLDVCDAVLRLYGESSGADREVAKAEALGIPVFYSLDALIEWVENVARCDARDMGKQEQIQQRRKRLRAQAADLRAEYRALPEETPEEARDAARWSIQKAEHEERLLARQERGEPVRRAR